MLRRACLAGCLSSSPNGMGFIALPALSLKITQLKLVRKIYAFQQAPCFQPAQQPSPDTAQKYLCNRNRRSAPCSQGPSQTQPGVLAPLCALNTRNCLLRDLSLLLFCFLWHLSVLHQLVVPGLSGVHRSGDAPGLWKLSSSPMPRALPPPAVALHKSCPVGETRAESGSVCCAPLQAP